MTLRKDGVQKNLFSQICQLDMAPVDLKLRLRPWLNWAIAYTCLALGIRMLKDSGPYVAVIGLALLFRVPSYLYLGLCQYRRLKERRISLALGGYTSELDFDSAPESSCGAGKAVTSRVLIPA